MEVQRSTRYPIRGRAQIALPNQTIYSGNTIDISTGGVCILLENQIPLELALLIRFEIKLGRQVEILTARVKSIYCVLSSQGGFRAGLQFCDDDSQRAAVIKKLSGKKSTMAQEQKQTDSPIKKDFLTDF